MASSGLYMLWCSELAPCRESFHCILAGKLCSTALSPLPSAPLKLTCQRCKCITLFSQSACGCLDVEVSYQRWLEKTGTVLDRNLSCIKNLHRRLEHAWKTHLRGLEVLQKGRRTAGQATETEVSERWWEYQEEHSIHIFLVTGQNMNMSARIVFGKGRLTPKQLSFTFPQTDSLRKGGQPAGGKRKMFSFSLRCRLGIIRGRTKGKTYSKAMELF